MWKACVCKTLVRIFTSLQHLLHTQHLAAEEHLDHLDHLSNFCQGPVWNFPQSSDCYSSPSRHVHQVQELHIMPFPPLNNIPSLRQLFSSQAEYSLNPAFPSRVILLFVRTFLRPTDSPSPKPPPTPQVTAAALLASCYLTSCSGDSWAKWPPILPWWLPSLLMSASGFLGYRLCRQDTGLPGSLLLATWSLSNQRWSCVVCVRQTHWVLSLICDNSGQNVAFRVHWGSLQPSVEQPGWEAAPPGLMTADELLPQMRECISGLVQEFLSEIPCIACCHCNLTTDEQEKHGYKIKSLKCRSSFRSNFEK